MRAVLFPLLLLAHAVMGASVQEAVSVSPATVADAGHRIAALRAEIAHHDDLYFRQAAPEISDYEYDQLKHELAELERAFPDAAASIRRPQPTIGDDRTGAFPTHRHRERMLGLAKTYEESELRAFHAKLVRQLGRDDLAYVVEPKVDGIAISVTFEHGQLTHAATRGNGTAGDGITANVLTIPGLPHALAARAPDGSLNPIPELIELRGEIYLTFAEFERINREREADGETPFANPRNAAAGSAKLTDPEQAAGRRLSIVFYGWGACEPASLRPSTQHALAPRLRAWGLPALEPGWLVPGIDAAWARVQRFGHDRRQLPFATDGAVLKLDDVSLRDQLGETTDAPRWAIAYKYAPDRVATQLLAITIQVGRTGLLTPVAELAPVDLGGSTIARATLHNRDIIARRDFRVGDFVYVEKAGEIIPTIVGVDLARRPPDSEPYLFPTACPACGTTVVAEDRTATVRCPNPACPARIRRRLEHFASKEGVDIDGLGPAMIDVLVTRGWVRNVADIFRLQRADLLTLGSDLDVSTDNLLAAIDHSKHADLWRYIHGFGIPGVGEATARDLARRFGDLPSLARARPDDFADGGQGATAAAVLAHFADPQNQAVVTDLLALGVDPRPPVAIAANPNVAGKVFVLTGKLPHFTRAQATQRIEAAGGTVNGSVSRQTDYVVAGDDPGSKLERARALRITVIDETELLRMLAVDP